MTKIPEQHTWRYFFHMTDIRNLESIIDNGLLSTNKKNELGIKHVNIANMSIQNRRAEMNVPCGNGGKVHDYVPFYFSSLNPMLLGVLYKKNQDQPFIIFLCLKISKLESLSAVFTDASANTTEPPHFYDDVADLDKLSWELIDSKKWSYPTEDDRHRKMAEALAFEKVDFSQVDCIVVYNEGVKKRVVEILKKADVKGVRVIYPFELVGFKYDFYYTKFFIDGRDRETLISGPFFLRRNTEEGIKEVIENRKAYKGDCEYNDIEALVSAIDGKFDCIEELAGIYGLQSNNPMHPETVSLHTQTVVSNIKRTSFYQQADAHTQKVLELAAYLHDIGKGPKEKWKDGKQPVYPDHPSDAIPMVCRILTEEVKNISDEDVRTILLLVAYHDILGDCKFCGRDVEQVVKVIKSEAELDMLFAISEADICSINTVWYDDFMKVKDEYRQQILDLWRQE